MSKCILSLPRQFRFSCPSVYISVNSTSVLHGMYCTGSEHSCSKSTIPLSYIITPGSKSSSWLLPWQSHTIMLPCGVVDHVHTIKPLIAMPNNYRKEWTFQCPERRLRPDYQVWDIFDESPVASHTDMDIPVRCILHEFTCPSCPVAGNLLSLQGMQSTKTTRLLSGCK